MKNCRILDKCKNCQLKNKIIELTSLAHPYEEFKPRHDNWTIAYSHKRNELFPENNSIGFVYYPTKQDCEYAIDLINKEELISCMKETFKINF
jgi:hypothetical protein